MKHRNIKGLEKARQGIKINRKKLGNIKVGENQEFMAKT